MAFSRYYRPLWIDVGSQAFFKKFPDDHFHERSFILRSCSKCIIWRIILASCFPGQASYFTQHNRRQWRITLTKQPTRLHSRPHVKWCALQSIKLNIGDICFNLISPSSSTFLPLLNGSHSH